MSDRENKAVCLTKDVYINPDNFTSLVASGPNTFVNFLSGKHVIVSLPVAEVARMINSGRTRPLSR